METGCASPPRSGKPDGFPALPLEPRVQGRLVRIDMAEDVFFPRRATQTRAGSAPASHARRCRSAANDRRPQGASPRHARTPPRDARQRAHRRGRTSRRPPARVALHADARPCRRLLGGRWRNRAACLAAAPAGTPSSIACPCCTTTTGCVSRPGARAIRWSPIATAFPSPTSMPSDLLAPEDMALVVLPLVGFDAHAGGSAWAAAGTIAASRSGASAPAPPWLVGAGVRQAAGRCARARTLGRAARRGLHRTRLLHSRSPEFPHESTQALLADEIRARRISRSTICSASAPSRGPACATTRRAISCATACRSATACCSTTPTAKCPASPASPKSPAPPIRTRPSSRRSRSTTTTRRRREEPRWLLVDVGFVRKLQAPIPLERSAPMPTRWARTSR